MTATQSLPFGDAFNANAAADGVKLTERYSYDSLWNGLSVSVAPTQVAALRSVPGVKAVYPLAWTTSAVALSPYAGLYADYYFSKDDAQTVGLTTVVA